MSSIHVSIKEITIHLLSIIIKFPLFDSMILFLILFKYKLIVSKSLTDMYDLIIPCFRSS